jgi:hypothetical protein
MWITACFEKHFATEQRLNLAKAIPNNDMCNIAVSKKGEKHNTVQMKLSWYES